MSGPFPAIICKLAELHDGDSRGVTVEQDGKLHDLIVVMHAGRVFAYLNRCPHTGAPLDWAPDRFLSLDGRHIQCANHAALFRIEDGVCIAGPCHGNALAAVPVEVSEGVVRLPSGYRMPG